MPQRIRFTVGEEQRIVSLYRGGGTTFSIGEGFGVSQVPIARVLKEQGVPLRSPGRRRTHSLDDTAFDTLTPESAYWVGFLMADGCVVGKRLSLGLSVCDREHVEQFKAFMKSSHRIHIEPGKGYANAKPLARIYIRSRKVAETLAGYGVVPKKSKTAEAGASVANNPDFWRGVLEGDGYITFKGQNPAIGIVGSHRLLTQFSQYIATEIGGEPRPVHRLNSHWVFRLNGTFAVAAMRSLYPEGCVSLPRKFTLAQKALAYATTQRRDGCKAFYAA